VDTGRDGGVIIDHMSYQGIVIAESLEDPKVLTDLRILKTTVEPVTAEDATPWLTQWTMHTVEVSEDLVASVVERLSKAIDPLHRASWYVDLKNVATHYIVFYHKVFRVDRSKPMEYEEVKRYGRSLGIPEKQLDFSPENKE